jgi:hypothetical protein
VRFAPLGDFVLDRTIVARYRLNYRTPEQEKRWAPLWAEDTLNLFCHVIPPIAAELGVGRAELAAAARRACYRRLADASRVLAADEREVQDWARECGLARALDQFRAGRMLARRNYGPIRNALSEISRGYRDMVRRARRCSPRRCA